MEGGGGAGDAALRLFRVSVDVRSFKAGVRLPMRAVNAFVKVVLPPEIVKLALESANPGSNAAKLTAPLRSHPPVLVERCSEVTIPNGYVALELPVSVLGLAATLAQDPHLLAEVYHRDRYAADSVIGIARISMAPLMHDPRLDGYVTVRNEKQVTTGSIRIVLAAEELGPVSGSQHKRVEGKEPSLNHPCPGLEESFLLLKNNISQYLGSKAVAVQTDTSAAEGASKKNGQRNAEKEKTTATAAASTAPAVQHEKASVSFQTASKDAVHGAAKDEKSDELREHVEYELAWEFEMWRRSEEARWRAELKEKEVATIKALEEESKRKQKDQAAALDKVRLELANLEAKLRTKLLAVEKRDRTLVHAEEEAALRKEALQRECAQRVADAENVAKRMQADYQQRIEMEHGKFVMLQQQYAAVEQRLASTNATLAAVEKEFAAYKSAQRLSSEADLAAQILVLKHQCHELEKKADAAEKTRDEYKAQVIRLAKELANMRKRSQEPPPPRPSSGGRDTTALTAMLQEHLRAASQDKLELKQLKEQVERLQQQEQAALTAAAVAAAAAATAAVSQRQVNTEALSKEATANAKESEPDESKHETKEHKEAVILATSHPAAAEPEQRNPVPQKPPLPPPPPPPPPPPKGELYERLAAMEHIVAPSFDDSEPFLSQITAFQRSEIVRLTKQKADLLQTGVYTVHDRIIRGLDEEIRRLRSIDTAGLCSR